MDWGVATMDSIIIAAEQLPNQEYGQRLELVLGKESYAENGNGGFFTRVRRASDSTTRTDHEWSGHYGMTLIEAAIDFETRLRGTGQALNMLFNQIREVKQ
jgi:hypothetical protein